MSVQPENDPQLSGYDPQTWKDERRKKLERRKKDRQRQVARRTELHGKRRFTDEDFDE
jgi:hypothetical protein